LEQVSSFYDGTWHLGLPDGLGCSATPEEEYRGSWQAGRRAGFGTLVFPGTDALYQGGFADGSREGFGVMRYASGDVYEGMWAKGARHGKGTHISPSQVRYVGDWVEDAREGRGSLFLPGRRLWYEGGWHRDQRQGDGVCNHVNGDVYTGGWLRDCKHGFGKLTKSDKCTYEGEWSLDTKSGHGIETSTQETYQGWFHGNLRHGRGVLDYASGSQVTGVWIDGRLDCRVSATVRGDSSANLLASGALAAGGALAAESGPPAAAGRMGSDGSNSVAAGASRCGPTELPSSGRAVEVPTVQAEWRPAAATAAAAKPGDQAAAGGSGMSAAVPTIPTATAIAEALSRDVTRTPETGREEADRIRKNSGGGGSGGGGGGGGGSGGGGATASGGSDRGRGSSANVTVANLALNGTGIPGLSVGPNAQLFEPRRPSCNSNEGSARDNSVGNATGTGAAVNESVATNVPAAAGTKRGEAAVRDWHDAAEVAHAAEDPLSAAEGEVEIQGVFRSVIGQVLSGPLYEVADEPLVVSSGDRRGTRDGVYTGLKMFGLPWGQGKHRSANGDVYEGEYLAGKASGAGVCTYAAPVGGQYSGRWAAGRWHGYGRLVRDGRTIVAIFAAGRVRGVVEVSLDDPSLTFGAAGAVTNAKELFCFLTESSEIDWSRDVSVHRTDGSVFTGTLSNGVPAGDGVFHIPSLRTKIMASWQGFGKVAKGKAAIEYYVAAVTTTPTPGPSTLPAASTAGPAKTIGSLRALSGSQTSMAAVPPPPAPAPVAPAAIEVGIVYTGAMILPGGELCGARRYRGNVAASGDRRAFVPHGTGRMTWADGSSLSGHWHMGALSGEGVLETRAVRYAGTFAKNLPSGQGVASYVNGFVLRATFREGVASGTKCKLVYPLEAGEYSGPFDAGKRHGIGKFVWRETGVTFLREYELGRLVSETLLPATPAVSSTQPPPLAKSSSSSGFSDAVVGAVVGGAAVSPSTTPTAVPSPERVSQIQ
jgi:hypothetical protein